MRKHFYLNLLIFCAVLSQGIAVISDDNIEESLKLHSRKKRVIDESPAGGSPVHLSMARYVVNILRNGVSHCAGAILAADIIITIPFCVETHDNVTYTILSNSRLRNGGTPHHISIKSANVDLGFAVVRITPFIELHHGLNVPIELFLGRVPRIASGDFSGWGCTSPDPRTRHSFPMEMMQTKLPIITHQECSQRFGHPRPGHHICTFDTSRRRAAGLGDQGAPLVYRGQLLGLLLHLGSPTWDYPDTFCGFNSPHMHELVDMRIIIVRGVHF